MPSVQKILFAMVPAVEFIMGIFGNGFIVMINSIDWFRNRKISLMDFILTCLAVSRFCFLWTTISCVSFHLVYEKIHYSQSLFVNFSIIWIGSNYFSMACTTCLSVFYFLKIGYFSNPIFLWMKQKAHKVLLIIILGTTLYFCIVLIFMKTSTKDYIDNWKIMEKNITIGFSVFLGAFIAQLTLLTMILVIFFVVSLTSLLLLILSLWRHSRRMKLQGIHSRDSSTEAHIRAMKTMTSSLLFFILHCFSQIIMMLAYSLLDNTVAKACAHVLIFLYPSGHPFLLILWNRKLKQTSLCVLRKLKCVKESSTSHS